MECHQLKIKIKTNKKVKGLENLRAYLVTIIENNFQFFKTKNQENMFSNKKLFFVICS